MSAEDTRADALGDRLDGPALSRRVATFEDDDDPKAFRFHPFLQHTQLALQLDQFFRVLPCL